MKTSTFLRPILWTFLAFSCAIAFRPQAAEAVTSYRFDHEYQSILRDIPLANACLTKSEVRSKTPVHTCIQLESKDESVHFNSEPTPTWSCRTYADVTLAYPRQIDVQTCISTASAPKADPMALGTCAKWSHRTLRLPDTIEVRVTPIQVRDVPDPAASLQTFTFPDCP